MEGRRNSFLVGKAFKAYLLATVLTVAATQIAQIVDASLVGQLISAEALGAVNFSKPVLQMTFSIGNLFIIGGSVLAGMAIGTGDRDKANRIFTICLGVVIAAGIVILVCGEVFFDFFLSLLCNSDALRGMAGEYMRITFITMLPFLISYILETYVIVDGAPKLATSAVIISNILNIILDITFIKFCGWGVQGAALATCIMYTVSVLILLIHFLKKKEGQKTFSLDFHREKGILGQMAKMGLPMTITTFLIAIQIAGANIISIKYLGNDGVIAYAVCIALLGFSMIFVAGTMRTIQPVGAILKGMGDSRGILLMMGRAYRFLTICLLAMTAIILIFPNFVSGLFGVKDAAMLPYVGKAIAIFTVYIILEGIFSLFIPVYQFYDHSTMANYVALAKSVFPIIGFWIAAVASPENAWWGFAFGQIAVWVFMIPFTVVARKKDPTLSRTLLIPIQSEREAFDISIPARLESMKEATDGILSFLTSNGVSDHSAKHSVLCCEELINNIIGHSNAHFIDVKAIVADGKATISLHDDGTAFDPVKKAEECAANQTDDETGDEQLGLNIVREIASNIRYDYIFNQNMVTVEVQ